MNNFNSCRILKPDISIIFQLWKSNIYDLPYDLPDPYLYAYSHKQIR